MAFQIISDKDKDGNFVISKEAWSKEKIDELMDKYYPNRSKKRTEKQENPQLPKKQ